MLKVAVVCRANQVRSRIAEAYFQTHFPQIECLSFGTEPGVNNSVSRILIDILNSWGLNCNPSLTRDWADYRDYLFSADLVIAVDDEIKLKLANSGLDALSLCDFAIDSNHKPIDPIGLSHNDFKINTAKVVHCTARLIFKILNEDLLGFGVTSITQLTSTNHIELPKDGYIIDARVRHLGERIISGDDPTHFTENSILDFRKFELVRNDSRVYIPKFEFSHPEKFLLSRNWKDFVTEVAQMGPVYVISAPKNVKIWDTYLCTIVANASTYV